MSTIHRLRIQDNDPHFGSHRLFDAFKYAPAVRANGFLFIAGQVGLRADGSIPDTVDEQIRCAFERLQAILAHEGLNFSHLVDLTSYHVNLAEQLDTFRTIKDEFITHEFPAWTILGVQSLARDSLWVEIKAVAVLDASSPS